MTKFKTIEFSKNNNKIIISDIKPEDNGKNCDICEDKKTLSGPRRTLGFKHSDYVIYSNHDITLGTVQISEGQSILTHCLCGANLLNLIKSNGYSKTNSFSTEF